MRHCPVAIPAGQAVRMALAMREHLAPLRERWRAQAVAVGCGHRAWPRARRPSALLSCAGRVDYAMLGPVMELAEGLCDAAPPGQILLTAAVGAAVAGMVDVAPVCPLPRRGGPDLGVVLQVLGGHPPRDGSSR